MKKIIEIVNKYGLLIILLLSFATFFRTCSISQKLKEHTQLAETQLHRIDSLLTRVNTHALNTTDISLANNNLMKEYNLLIFGILNNKITSDELGKRLKDIESSLIKINNNNVKNTK